MSRKKCLLKVLAVFITAMFVCIGCGKKSNSTNSIADYVEQIYNDGAKAVNNASSMDEVQDAYYNAQGEVTLLLSETEKKIEPEDSVRIDDALKGFLEVCCKKAREFDSYLNTDKGLYYMDDEGNVKCGDDEPQGYHLDNPAMIFKAYKPVYKAYQVDDEMCYQFLGVTVLDIDGEVKYSDEDAEQYYDYYVSHFFFAYKIATTYLKDKGQDIAPYLQENLFNVVCNLPLDDSYPDDVKDKVNKIYYDCKDKVMNMRLYKRGYGYVEYAYETFRDFYGGHNIRCFKIYRDENSGNILLGESTHGYNPPNAY